MSTLAAQIVEVKREVALRQRVYPHLVQQDRMTQADADQHLSRMQAVLATLEGLILADQPPLFSQETTP